jgi:hypothetical protein
MTKNNSIFDTHNSRSNQHEISTWRKGLAGSLGILMIFGFYHRIEDNQKITDANTEVTAGLPNFQGKTASQFVAGSPKVQKELKGGELLEVYADNIPMAGVQTPNSIDNIAWDISPSGADVNNTVNQALATNQDSQNAANQYVVVPGQEFIVNPTPGAVKLARAEAKQGLYPN